MWSDGQRSNYSNSLYVRIHVNLHRCVVKMHKTQTQEPPSLRAHVPDPIHSVLRFPTDTRLSTYREHLTASPWHIRIAAPPLWRFGAISKIRVT